jgi:acyl transferase domain-containing protein
VPSYAGLLDDVERFDADFFGIEAQARLLDPQQRMFLEVTWEALEHAGIHLGRCAAPAPAYSPAPP